MMTTGRRIPPLSASLAPLAALVAVEGPLGAQGAARATDPVPAHDTLTVTSRALGETRTVNVHVPAGYGASATVRCPVPYMRDGGVDEDFPHVVRTVDSLHRTIP